MADQPLSEPAPPVSGGPAFPSEQGFIPHAVWNKTYRPGMSLRDWFAGQVQADDRLVKIVRGMDDKDLAIFARCPDTEEDFFCLGEVEKYLHRFTLEAKAIARVRFIQADAMIAEGTKKEEPCQTKN